MKKYVLSLDAGSTGVRGILFDKTGKIVGRSYTALNPLHTVPGAHEYDGKELWGSLYSILEDLFKKQGFNINEIDSIGISTQRASFGIWDKETGEPLHNFIGWADTRCEQTLQKMNRNKVWRIFKGFIGFLGRITNIPFFLTLSILKLTTDHASVRLRWLLDSNPEFITSIENGTALFGSLDTWFIYNLTNRQSHVTEPTNATATSLFNPFDRKWNGILCKIFKIPMGGFAEVKETCSLLAETSKEVTFGTSVPIYASMADQSAALFGNGCFEVGDAKISQGSGSFVGVNVGHKAKVSKRGLFPLIAWTMDQNPTYMVEGFVATAGTLIDWLGTSIGLYNTPEELNALANRGNRSHDVLFIPTPSGIRYPYFKSSVRGSFIGLSLATKKEDVALAVIEGLAMRLVDILEAIEKDTKIRIEKVKVDGGVSKSNILLQRLADFSGIKVQRAPEADMTATGAAFMAGLGSGFYKDTTELKALLPEYEEFLPQISKKDRSMKRTQWKRALKGILNI